MGTRTALPLRVIRTGALGEAPADASAQRSKDKLNAGAELAVLGGVGFSRPVSVEAPSPGAMTPWRCRNRWTIERTMAWVAGCRRLHRRYECKADHFLAFTSIARTLICYRRLGGFPPR